MAASPASPADRGQPTARPGSLTDWLRRRSDRQLLRLLELRPDLALPAPPDITTLAARVSVRTSVQRAVDALDAAALQALETLVLTAAPGEAISDPDRGALDELFDRALVWGEPDLVHLVPTVREALGPYPGGLGRPAAALFPTVADLQLVPVLRRLGLPPGGQPRAGAAVAARLADPEWLAGQLADLDGEERAIVTQLAAGPPVGAVRPEPFFLGGGEPDAPHRLVARGLLVPLDSQRVELPREVGLAMRAAAPTRVAPAPPQIRVVDRAPADLDRLGTTAVLTVLRLVDALGEAWTAQPPATLRAGGLGVRDLRRTAKELGLSEGVAALVLEIVFAAGLLNATAGPEPVFLPTAEYDAWHEQPTARRWTALASTWLGMTRQASLVGQRDERDRVINALSPDVERGTQPALRRQVLDALGALPPGGAPADRGDVLAALAWHQPRRARGQRPAVEAVLAEADLLGVTAAGGLTGYTRTLLAGSAAAAEHALEHALPDPVGHFVVQPDLTLVVPGPPEPALGGELALVADLESSGGASVYRVTAATVRRAMDHGRTGTQLAEFFAHRSRTPVPQALNYLIEDAARRHGALRTGTAGAYLRCDDTALLARAVSDRASAGLRLRLLAPTVAVSEAPVTRVLDVLRAAGFAPAAESADGEVVTLGADPARAPSRPLLRTVTSRPAYPTDAHLGELVRRMRAADAAQPPYVHRTPPLAGQVAGVTSAATMELLRRAIREDRAVAFGAAAADGRVLARTVRPISLAAGQVRGYEPGRDGLVAYPVHRITWVRLLTEPDDDADFDPA